MSINWSAVGAIAGSALSLFGSKKSAEDSSALQYHYQTMLNRQNYNYNTKLINQQNAFNEKMMDKANAWNLDRWNESVDLANTAHQREIKDLRSAGLNPILSANGGASVVNPIQSAQASSGNSQLSSSAGMPDVDYLQGLQTASQVYQENRRVKNELENSETNRDFTRKQANKTVSDMKINQANSAAQIAKQKAETDEIRQNIENSKKITDAQVTKLVSDAKLNEENSARSRQETQNLANNYKHYEVNRGISLGKFGTIGITTHPNEKPVLKKKQGYEFIKGKPIKVTTYSRNR